MDFASDSEMERVWKCSRSVATGETNGKFAGAGTEQRRLVGDATLLTNPLPLPHKESDRQKALTRKPIHTVGRFLRPKNHEQLRLCGREE